jgi:hypothetical protein
MIMIVGMIVIVGMNMTVGQFFGSGLPNGVHGNVKTQVQPRQRVVSVYGYRLIYHIGNRYQLKAVGSLRMELHTRLDRIGPLKPFQGNIQNHPVVPLPVGLRRGNGNGKLVSLFFAFQGLFQTGDNISKSMKIIEGFREGGGVDNAVIIVRKGIGYANYPVFCDIHGLFYHNYR